MTQFTAFVCAIVGVFVAGPVFASDKASGVQTMTYLSSQAEVIAVIDKAELRKVPDDTRAVVFRVTVGAKLKGNLENPVVDIFLPREDVYPPRKKPDMPVVAAVTPESLAGKVVFLLAVRPSELSYWWNNKEQPPWLAKSWAVVGGREGITATQAVGKPNQLEQIKSYLQAKKTGDPAELLTWAERTAIDPASHFLLNSAVVSVNEVASNPKMTMTDEWRKRSASLLDSTVKSSSQEVTDDIKAMALNVYSKVQKDKDASKMLLEHVANDEKLPLALRHMAVRDSAKIELETSGKLNHGEFVAKFDKSPKIKPFAEQVCKSVAVAYSAAKPVVTEEALNKLRVQLKQNDSKARSSRLEALRTALEYSQSPELLKTVTTVAESAHDDEIVQVAAIRTLAALAPESEATVKTLKSIVLKNESEAVRHAGVMAMSKLSQPAAKTTLKELSLELPMGSKARAAAESFSRDR